MASASAGVSAEWRSRVVADHPPGEHRRLGRRAGLGVVVLQGQQGREVRVAAKAAHGRVQRPVQVLAGVGIGPPGAGLLVPADGTEPFGVAVVEVVQPGLQAGQLAVVEGARLQIEQGHHGVAQLDQRGQLGLLGLGGFVRFDLPADDPPEPARPGGHDRPFLAHRGHIGRRHRRRRRTRLWLECRRAGRCR